MSESLRFHAIILAAGLSRRMGKANKLLLPYAGQRILEKVLEQLQATEIQGITVVLGHERDKVAPLLSRFEVRALYNPDFAQGQGTSIRAGVRALPPNIDGFLIGLGDMPGLQTAHYQKLLTEYRHHHYSPAPPILRPFHQKQPGHPVLFHASYQKALLAGNALDGAREVVQKHRQHLHRFNTTDPAYFWDIDTKEDYERRPLAK